MNDSLLVHVADDGLGIDPDQRDAVFEYGTTTDEDAIGGRLTIAETRARLLGWAVTIQDSASGGCRVEVTGVEFE